MKIDEKDWHLFEGNKKFTTCCPFHKELTPSCSIDPMEGTFHCYECGLQGYIAQDNSLFTD